MRRVSKLRKIAQRRRHQKHRELRGKKRFFRRRKAVRRKLAYYKSSRVLAIRAICKTLRKLEKLKKTRISRLVKQNRQAFILSALHFKLPALGVSLSAAEKQQQYLHRRSVRQRQYGRLSELADTFTALVPALIGKLVNKKISTQNFNKTAVAAIVQAAY